MVETPVEVCHLERWEFPCRRFVTPEFGRLIDCTDLDGPFGTVREPAQMRRVIVFGHAAREDLVEFRLLHVGGFVDPPHDQPVPGPGHRHIQETALLGLALRHGLVLVGGQV